MGWLGWGEWWEGDEEREGANSKLYSMRNVVVVFRIIPSPCSLTRTSISSLGQKWQSATEQSMVATTLGLVVFRPLLLKSWMCKVGNHITKMEPDQAHQFVEIWGVGWSCLI